MNVLSAVKCVTVMAMLTIVVITSLKTKWIVSTSGNARMNWMMRILYITKEMMSTPTHKGGG